MSLLESFEFIPGVKWFESEMHDSLFQHSVFGAIVFLVVSNTDVYKYVKSIIFDVTGHKADGNTMQLIHAVVFALIMYFGSLFILAPLLTEGGPTPAPKISETELTEAEIVRLKTALDDSDGVVVGKITYAGMGANALATMKVRTTMDKMKDRLDCLEAVSYTNWPDIGNSVPQRQDMTKKCPFSDLSTNKVLYP